MENKTQIAINFCPTGMVPTKSMTPFVPLSPTEIIEEVHQAYEIGITIAHIHARDENGKPTHLKSVNQEIIEGIKKHCPELIICASSSGRLVSDFQLRSEVIELKPDMCSLTLSSLNFGTTASVNSPETILNLIEKMNQHGVIPELECFDLGMINYGKYLIERGYIQGLKYWNLIFGNIFGMQSDLNSIAAALNQIPNSNQTYISFGGLGKHQFPVNQYGIISNHGIRIGLEDNLWLDDQKKVLATNIQLLERVHDIMEINGKEFFQPSTFKKQFGMI